MLTALLLTALLVQAPPPDTALFISREELIRLYTDCDEDRWPWGVEETFVPKTVAELTTGVAQRRLLESRWRDWFAAHGGDSIAPTAEAEWVYPLTVRGRLLNNFNNPREGGPHEALDIFVLREGVTVRTPVSGVVVASGDDWVGSYRRRQGLQFVSGGLSRRAGNGVMIFDPVSGGYLYFAHLQTGVLVRTGDVVRAGQPLGRVGHTGNASQPGHGRHLHFAFKRAGMACGIDGVLLPINSYQVVRAARGRMDAARAATSRTTPTR